METDVKTLTELADKILKQTDVQIRYSGVCNLESKIEQDFRSIINACRDLISENSKLRFSDYLIYYYNIISNHNFANKCLRLCMNHSDSLTEYENEPGEKRIERRQKLNQYDGVITIEGKSPDLIYCENGSCRIFNDVCQSFEYRLSRKIQKCGINNEELKTIFQIVCLDIALRNELRIINDEASLLGISVGQKQNLPTRCIERKKGGRRKVTEQDAKTWANNLSNNNKKYKEAVNTGKIVNGFEWTKDLSDLVNWLSIDVIPVKDVAGREECQWAYANNIFSINGKKISSKTLKEKFAKM